MIADDAIFMRASIRKMLEDNGHVVVAEASNGIETIEKFAEVKPDVIILDITMPEMNGLEALKRIKIIDPKAKVIICSAIGQQSRLAEAIECGVEEFILKPFEAHHLMEALEKVLG